MTNCRDGRAFKIKTDIIAHFPQEKQEEPFCKCDFPDFSYDKFKCNVCHKPPELYAKPEEKFGKEGRDEF